MSLLRACAAAMAWAYWCFVAINAGPRHHAYNWAVWRAHMNRLAVRAFLGDQQ